ncbi:antibiotic biosynthesis monooxygenase [Virgibacillus halophilus]|uniref:Antibiotic biosynthesis monooxygenase n=1 Tax=Tigheibacillus halophilus TaxID=361280 RepID=A0ABU5C276_9BACI|nr:antibiotic biosynthesis monooxygenase [Virgibacillus halophilus]
MYVVTNVISVKKGYANELIALFETRKGIEEYPGFIRFELLIAERIPGHDEVHVHTTWDSKEDFQGWLRSDWFTKAHSKMGGYDYIIGNKVLYYEMAMQVKRKTAETA